MGVEYEYQELSETCINYYNGIPTFLQLKENPPPEWIPLVGVGAAFLVINAVTSFLAFRNHIKFVDGPTTIPALRTLMILSIFGVFSILSFVGMLSLRSSKFLHSVADIYEVFCILFFLENMIGHLHLNKFFDEARKLLLYTPPCCCCLRCLPVARSSGQNVSRIRKGLYMTIISWVVLEFIRVIRSLECEYNVDSIGAAITNILMMVMFLFVMWGLFVIYKSGYDILHRYRYTPKFFAFKGMVFIAKFLYKILSYVASAKKGTIPGYYMTDGEDRYLVVKDKARISIWTNFISVVLSTVLLVLSYRLYEERDYTPYLTAEAYRDSATPDSMVSGNNGVPDKDSKV